jgi:hypothetical protein
VTEESAEDEGLGLDLIDPDAPLTSIPTEELPLAYLSAEEPVDLGKPVPRLTSSRSRRPAS